MPFFTYKALNLEGEIVRGSIEDVDMDVAYSNVSQLGLHILSIRKSTRLTKLFINKVKAWGIRPKDIIGFANDLAVMLKAGLPLLTSLADIADAIENKRFKERIADIRRTVELGSSLSSSISHHQDIFPDIFIQLVAIGEETGQLEKSLSDIVMHLQRMEDLKAAIKRALLYPTFAIVTTTGALLFWLIYVLPKISSLFKSMSVRLPLITQLLIAASDYSIKYWYVLLAVPAALIVIYKLMTKSELTRYYIDSAKLRLPIVKLVVYNKILALLTEQLRILLSAGLTIDKSFDIMIKLMGNLVFKKALTEVKKDILLGSRIYESMKKHGELFPNIVTRLIHIGEEAGNLTEQLDYMSREFLKRLNDVSQKMEKLIEPIVIVLVGGLFLVIIAGLMLPIYDLVSTMGGK
ncbi:MAG: type II secretion system F family protein [Nitrospirae bacterium]|nr:type II secretion system F family protein [Nitrospirota bacterium]